MSNIPDPDGERKNSCWCGFELSAFDGFDRLFPAKPSSCDLLFPGLLFLRQTLFTGRGGWTGSLPYTTGGQSLPEEFSEFPDHILSVLPLAPGF